MTNPKAPAQQLIDAIDAIAHANNELAELARRQRRAIAAMHADEVRDIVARQRLVGHALADAEDKRKIAAHALASAMSLPKATAIHDLARALAAYEPTLGPALVDAAKRARHAILECQREQRVVHAAASGVASHLEGLARQVLAHLNKAGVYAATGAIARATLPRGVDIVS